MDLKFLQDFLLVCVPAGVVTSMMAMGAGEASNIPTGGSSNPIDQRTGSYTPTPTNNRPITTSCN